MGQHEETVAAGSDEDIARSVLENATEDDIVTCTIEFAVRSADELAQALNAIRAIDGVEEALPR